MTKGWRLVHVRFPEALQEAAMKKAEDEGISFASYVRRAVARDAKFSMRKRRLLTTK